MLAAFLACDAPALAQTYAVPRAVVAGGGGASEASPFTVTGTAGQPEAGAALSGGTYEVAGGFWSFAGTDPCTFSIAPATRASIGAGGSGNVTVTVAASTSVCTWTSTSQVSWIAITSGSNGTGNGTVSYTVALNTTGLSRIGTLTIAGQTFTVTQAALPTMALSASRVNFGAVQTGAGVLRFQTPVQTLALTQSGVGPVSWTAAADRPWVTMSPAAGSGPGTISISVTHADVVLPAAGSLAATLTVTTTGATNAPTAAINLTVLSDGTETPPAGVFDTPLDGASNVTGSIAVTGWAIDDVGVTRVRLVRDAVAGVGEAPGTEIFIGDAVFVSGARPDVADLYPTKPYADRAGWGYLLLTNFLPNQGNGPVTLSVYADDVDGRSALLGRRTITTNNAAATAPFGAIDTPAQGGTVSGAGFINFGWALTPQPKSIPGNGSTIQVFIDSAPVGTLDSYNNARADIQLLFPGYANTDGAVGVKTLDTRTLANGVHTIAWVVADNQGAASGVGSRFFSVSNSNDLPVGDAGLAPAALQVRHVDATPHVVGGAAELDSARINEAALAARRGYGEPTRSELLIPDGDGVRHVRLAQLERLEVDLSTPGDGDEARYRGFERIGDELRALPVGATLDSATGVFAWAPGLAFGGTRTLVFVRECAHGAEQIRVNVVITR